MYPSISIVIPTYNSAKTLPLCLESIKNQNYPIEKMELIIADGGSKDNTVQIAKLYNVDKVVYNPLKTGEAGKAVGVHASKNEIIALIDSDNILPHKNWLFLMVEPFEDTEIVGAEPLYYTYRKEDYYITRYCALLGMNDPLCLFLGNYDRYSILSGKWTEMPIEEKDNGNYFKVKLHEKTLPTIGANGFLVRRSELMKCSIDEYLFDIDVVYELVKSDHYMFGKVKIGIIHIFSGNIGTFVRKQKRRIKDYMYYNSQNLRKYPWKRSNRLKVLKFILYTMFIFPVMFQSLIGYSKRRDLKVWSFHIIACWVTLFVYGSAMVGNLIFKQEIYDRCLI